jgi:RNA polymerase-binding transcription factor DksA
MPTTSSPAETGTEALRPPDIRAVLAVDRCATVRRIAALQDDVDAMIEAAIDVATDDEHDPEGATIAFERARIGALLDQARGHLTDIDDALRRLDDGCYGACDRCGTPIAPERLAARPVARTCIACAG